MLSETTGNGLANESEIRAYLEELFSGFLNISKDELDEDESFFSLGLTSVIHAEVHAELCKLTSDLSSTVLFEQPNLVLLTSFFNECGVSRDSLGIEGNG